MHPWMLVETTRVTEFEYYFSCTRKGVSLSALSIFGSKINNSGVSVLSRKKTTPSPKSV